MLPTLARRDRDRRRSRSGRAYGTDTHGADGSNADGAGRGDEDRHESLREARGREPGLRTALTKSPSPKTESGLRRRSPWRRSAKIE